MTSDFTNVWQDFEVAEFKLCVVVVVGLKEALGHIAGPGPGRGPIASLESVAHKGRTSMFLRTLGPFSPSPLLGPPMWTFAVLCR